MSTRRPRRDPITPALVTVAIVLALGVAAIVYFAETKDDSPGSGRSATGQPVGAATPAASPAAAPSVAPSVAISGAPASPTYRCWDATTTDSLTRCTDPSGEAAVPWIFPDEAAADRVGACHGKLGDERSVLVQCDLSWHGHVVHLHFSSWASWRSARTHYDGGHPTRTSSMRDDGSTLISWQPRRSAVPFADAPWKAAEMLRGRPWTLAAYADDRATAQQALAAFGRIRDVREWRGVEG